MINKNYKKLWTVSQTRIVLGTSFQSLLTLLSMNLAMHNPGLLIINVLLQLILGIMQSIFTCVCASLCFWRKMMLLDSSLCFYASVILFLIPSLSFLPHYASVFPMQFLLLRFCVCSIDTLDFSSTICFRAGFCASMLPMQFVLLLFLCFSAYHCFYASRLFNWIWPLLFASTLIRASVLPRFQCSLCFYSFCLSLLLYNYYASLLLGVFFLVFNFALPDNNLYIYFCASAVFASMLLCFHASVLTCFQYIFASILFLVSLLPWFWCASTSVHLQSSTWLLGIHIDISFVTPSLLLYL